MKKVRTAKKRRPSAEETLKAVMPYVDIESLGCWSSGDFIATRDLKAFGYSEKKHRCPADLIDELRVKAKEALDAYRA